MTPHEIINRALYSNNFKYKNYDRRQGIRCLPRISLGRQTGQTTAIISFIRNNPILTFAILGLYKDEYTKKYSHIKNAKFISYDVVYNNVHAGMRYDYIIIENALTNISVNNIFGVELEHMFTRSTPSTRLIAIGN
jgi:hypothetical protein